MTLDLLQFESQPESRPLHSRSLATSGRWMLTISMLRLRMLDDEMPVHFLPYEIRDENTPNILLLRFFKWNGKFYLEWTLSCQGGNSTDAP